MGGVIDLRVGMQDLSQPDFSNRPALRTSFLLVSEPPQGCVKAPLPRLLDAGWRGHWLRGQICLQGPGRADSIAVGTLVISSCPVSGHFLSSPQQWERTINSS